MKTRLLRRIRKRYLIVIIETRFLQYMGNENVKYFKVFDKKCKTVSTFRTTEDFMQSLYSGSKYAWKVINRRNRVEYYSELSKIKK